MNKENNRSAAGLRRSAIAERIRLREEWSALKEIDSQPNDRVKKQINVKAPKKTVKQVNVPTNLPTGRFNRKSNGDSPSNVLRGVVALVEVGSETRALPLRAALAALGATVMPAWSPLITHLIWAQGGCKQTRGRGRALACALVSPLWVEACAAGAARLPERAFPAAARASDLPSPATLRQMLKRAEAENIPLADLLDDEKEQVPRLRISSETDQDTSVDTSKDISGDTSHDTSKDATDIESRVNTAPRRALPKTSSVSPPPVIKSKRKLFTHKEAEMAASSEDENTQPKPTIPKPQVQTKKQPVADRRELVRAERMARRFLAACSGATHKHTDTQPRIVLTGMSRTERREVTAAILSLKGRIQKCVNKRTTHVILGSFQDEQTNITGVTRLQVAGGAGGRTLAALAGAARGCRVLRAGWARAGAARGALLPPAGYEVPQLYKISQKARVERSALAKTRSEYAYDVFCGMRVHVTSSAEQRNAAIELLKLCGAVVQDGDAVIQNGSQQTGIQNGGHKIQHGQGLTQLNKLLGNTQRQAISQKIINCGIDYDIKIGVKNGEVSSKWVFDSVAAARMRTTRRYVVNELSSQASQMLEEMANVCIDD